MTKKLAILVIGAALVGITVFAFGSQANFTVIGSTQNDPPGAPEQVVYHHLFRHVAALKAKADELERQGKDAAHLHRVFRRKANLSDEQAQITRPNSGTARSTKLREFRPRGIL